MDKKELKLYEAPTSEVMELDVHVQLLAVSTNPFEDSTGETEEME